MLTQSLVRELFHYGVFDSIKDAAEAYDKAAVYYFKEFALTNEELKDRNKNLDNLFGGK